MIIAFKDGRCCFKNRNTGGINCISEPEGEEGWYRTCNSGSFYLNSCGMHGDDGEAYEDSVMDLIDFIKDNYRVKEAETVEVPADMGYAKYQQGWGRPK
jgi:hypothetical protein